MNTGASISETRSQRKDIIGPYTLSFCINCRLQTSSNSDSLEHNMCTLEHGANREGLLICLRAPERATKYNPGAHKIRTKYNCALRSARAPMACYGRAGANWAVVHFHLLILGTTKYLEKSRSSNGHRSLNLRNYIPKKGYMHYPKIWSCETTW